MGNALAPITGPGKTKPTAGAIRGQTRATSTSKGAVRLASPGSTSSKVSISCSWVLTLTAGQPSERAIPAISIEPKAGQGVSAPAVRERIVRGKMDGVGAIEQRAPVIL